LTIGLRAPILDRLMTGRRVTGFVWITVGVLLFVVPLVLGRPLVVRGTRIPWGLLVAGIGLLIVGWDALRSRRRPGPE
jgi:hypothetical protein